MYKLVRRDAELELHSRAVCVCDLRQEGGMMMMMMMSERRERISCCCVLSDTRVAKMMIVNPRPMTYSNKSPHLAGLFSSCVDPRRA